MVKLSIRRWLFIMLIEGVSSVSIYGKVIKADCVSRFSFQNMTTCVYFCLIILIITIINDLVFIFLFFFYPRLLILTILNLGLFFKLWAMEDVAHRMYLSTKQRMRERAEGR